MKVLSFLKNNIDESARESFEGDVAFNNIYRGRILAAIVIGIEFIYLSITVAAYLIKFDNRFDFTAYLAMYGVMILLNMAYLLFFKNYTKEIPKNKRNQINIVTVAYITFIMVWGSVISLMDQKLYGHLITFMINMIVCSVIYLLDNKKILIPYFTSVLVLAIGLPYVQHSRDILIGHYANLFVFVIVTWVGSRIIYNNYCENYYSRILLNKMNLLLEQNIAENRKINVRLAIANSQLKECALMDDLTGIPNRRSFREFIDRAFQNYIVEDSTLSIIMIDIDFFKQFNDSYGHEEGDKALIAVANQINSIIEDPSEFAVRWGGEEFIYAAFNKSEEDIKKIASDIRTKISELKIPHTESSVHPYITVSLGTSTIPIAEKKDVNRAIKLADQALYFAKSYGRDCIQSINDDLVESSDPVLD